MKSILFILFFSLTTGSYFAQQEEALRYTYERENVVASVLEGTWRSDQEGRTITFSLDTTIIAKIPEKFIKILKDATIYHAGILQLAFDAEEDIPPFPYVLIAYKGQPHLLFFMERDGEPMDDAESFNLFIARADERAEDILYIGGDHNNQAFIAYNRVVE